MAAIAATLLAIWGNEVDDRSKRVWQNSNASRDEQLLRDVSRNFDLGDTDAFVVVQSDQLFSSSSVLALREMVSAIEMLPQVDSLLWVDQIPILNVFGLPEPLLPENDASEQSFEEARDNVLANPLVAGQLASPDGRTLIMPITLDWLEIENDEAGSTQILAVARRALAKHPELDIQVRLTGRVPVFVAQRQSFERNHRKFQTIGYVMVFVLAAALMFRGVIPIAIVGGVPALGVYWATGFLSLIGQEVNALTNVILPVLLTMIGLTDGVHLFLRIRLARRQGAQRVEASRIGIEQVGLACLLTSITTAIGFGSLLLAHSSFVRSFGIACGIGVLVQFAAVITLIPLLCSSRLGQNIHRGAQRSPNARVPQLANYLIDGIIRQARPLTVLAFITTTVLAAVALTLRPDERTESSLPSGTEALEALKHCDEAMGGIELLRVIVQWSDSIDNQSPEIVNVILDVEQILDDEPLVSHPLSVRNILATFPGDTSLPERMPFLQLLPKSLLDAYFNTEARRTLINVRVQDIGIATYLPVFERLESAFRELESMHPGFDVRLTGGPVVRGRELHRIVMDLATSLAAASIIILVVLTIAFRSFRIGLLTIIPNMFPLMVTASLLVVTGSTLGIASVCAFTVCLGIAVDDTIHFLTSYMAQRKSGIRPNEAIQRTLIGVGSALVQTTLVLIAGFLAVLTSDLPDQRTFAAMACSTIGAALIGDLLFLPAMLICFSQKDEDFTPSESKTASRNVSAAAIDP